MRKQDIALHSVHGELRRWVTPNEARDLVDSDKARWRCSRCGGSTGKGRCLGAGGQHNMVLRMLEPERCERNSAAALTAHDMQANVGITEGDAGAPAKAGEVKAAETKVRLWPFVGDWKAPRVMPRTAVVTALGLILCALLLPGLSLAQNTATISGKLIDGGGNAVTNAVIRFELKYCDGDASVASTGVLVYPLELRQGSGIDGSGNVTGNILKNSVISCFGVLGPTRWLMSKYVAGSLVSAFEYNITGATFDINAAVPSTLPSQSPSLPLNLTALTILGTLPVANGGTGLTSSGAAGNYLRSTGTVWASSPLLGADIPNNSANTTGSAGTAGNVTGTVTVAHGGTGVTSVTNNGVAYGNSFGPSVGFTAAGGAGTLCLIETAGGVPTFASCAGSASTNWGFLSDASQNLSINNGAFSSTISGTGLFSYGGNFAASTGISDGTDLFMGANAAVNGATVSGTSDTAIGAYAAEFLTTGSNNTAVGSVALTNVTIGASNTAVGRTTLSGITTGSANIALGSAAGSILASSAHDNIEIGNSVGNAGDNNQTRIGVAGSQTKAFIAGQLTLDSFAFASLGTPANGTINFCPDCTIANPCASGGNGAIAKRLNGVWVCN